MEDHEETKAGNVNLVIELFGKPIFSLYEEQLYEKTLAVIYKHNQNFLLKCKHCDKLFTRQKVKQNKFLTCLKTNISHDNKFSRGRHDIDLHWNVKSFILYAHKHVGLSWREIYWKVWSYMYIFNCEHCQ